MKHQANLLRSYSFRSRALVSEDRARATDDKSVKREWEQLAIEWHLLATVTANHTFDYIEAA